MIDYLHPINGRAAKWMLISRIQVISGSHHTTHILSMGDQKNEYLYQIHIRPLTSYEWEISRLDVYQQDSHSNLHQITYKLSMKDK